MSQSEGESTTFTPATVPDRAPDLRLLHYNDVYHVDASSAEPVGGIARFITLANYYRNDEKFKGQPELLTFFSGDAFNPSLESSVTKGSHMVPILNSIGTDVACVGNHDLDFGIRQFRYLAAQCKFPWLLANVLDPSLGPDVPLGNAQRTTMLTASNGVKIGVIGLGEREWLATINSLPPDLEYRSATQTAKLLIPDLKAQGADLIIALTHQREPNDNKLAENTGHDLIDIILGGHDHYYNHSLLNQVHVLRSGTDFKQLSYVECWRNESPTQPWHVRITRRDVLSHILENSDTLAQVEKLTLALKAKLEKPVGYTLAPLDARFTTVRTKESNAGNFVCDLMRYYYDSEACIMASGTIRGDQIYPPGLLKLRDIMNCFPFEDPVVVIKVSGKAILEALENAVSLYPALEGRFPQVSNICFKFDPAKPPMSRIDATTLTIAGEPADLTRIYKLTTRGYMARGKDGYTSLLVKSEGGDAEEIVNEENGVLISTIIRQYFMSLKVMGKWKMWGKSMERHWDAVHKGMKVSCPEIEPKTSANPLFRVAEALRKGPQQNDGTASSASSVNDDLSGYDTDTSLSPTSPRHTVSPWSFGEDERKMANVRKIIRKWRRLAGIQGEAAACDPMGEGEFQVKWTKAIAPRLERRIQMVGKDQK